MKEKKKTCTITLHCPCPGHAKGRQPAGQRRRCQARRQGCGLAGYPPLWFHAGDWALQPMQVVKERAPVIGRLCCALRPSALCFCAFLADTLQKLHRRKGLGLSTDAARRPYHAARQGVPGLWPVISPEIAACSIRTVQVTGSEGPGPARAGLEKQAGDCPQRLTWMVFRSLTTVAALCARAFPHSFGLRCFSNIPVTRA